MGERGSESVLNIARSVLADLDLDAVLERVLEAAQELAQARYAALGVLDESRSELSRFITRGIADSERRTIGALPRGRGVLGTLIEHPVPLRVRDVGQHPHSYGFPHGHPQMRSFLGVPIMIEGEPFGNLYLTEKAGGAEFSADDERSLVVLAEFAGVAIDHARRFAGQLGRREELERSVAALQASMEIARAVGGETDPDVVLELVAKRGRALVSARALVVELIEGDELVIAQCAGELPATLIGQRMAAADTLAGHAMRTRSPHRLEEDVNRARFQEHGVGQLGVQASSGLVVPLVFRSEVYGVLLAIDRLRNGPSFSPEDQRLLEAFATSAATAVATARSVAADNQRHRLAAAESERKRWARELHDETLQSLSVLRIALSGARRAPTLEAIQQILTETVEETDQAIAGLRALITDLRPAVLDELGAQAAIELLAERFGRHGLAVDVSVELAFERGSAPTRHTAELETALYRITQEALTNAAKHGRATRAVVEIHEEADIVRVSVRDDGDGFDPSAQTEGFGLAGMRERIALLDGELLVDSAPGQGATISARIPARRREEAVGRRVQRGNRIR